MVETTNFNGLTGSYGRNGNGNPTSKALRLVERFALSDPETLQYRVTVEDPQTWTRPWTVAFPMKREAGYEMYDTPATRETTRSRTCFEAHAPRRRRQDDPRPEAESGYTTSTLTPRTASGLTGSPDIILASTGQLKTGLSDAGKVVRANLGGLMKTSISGWLAAVSEGNHMQYGVRVIGVTLAALLTVTGATSAQRGRGAAAPEGSAYGLSVGCN